MQNRIRYQIKVRVAAHLIQNFQLNRVKAAEKEKESLEGPKNEACEFIREDNELTLKKYTLSQTFM